MVNILFIFCRRGRSPDQLRAQAKCIGFFGFVMLCCGVICLAISVSLNISGLIGASISLMVPGSLFLFIGWRYHTLANRAVPVETATVTTITTGRGLSSNYANTGTAYGFQQPMPTSNFSQYSNAPPPYAPQGAYPAAPPPPAYYSAT